MFFISIILLTILIPSIQSVKPTLKLTFTPDEKYYQPTRTVDIACEVINPIDGMEPAQLWYVDFKNNRRTQVSRTLINTPPDDSPDVFKNNRNHIEYVKKNHIRIKALQLDDSGQYECDCPDCDEPLVKQTKLLQVMKLHEPKLTIEPGWPLQEDAKTTIRCTADDFYPYVSHKIIRHHHDITAEGRTTATPNSNMYPHKFSWENTVTPKADWHNTTLRCTVLEGNSEQHVSRVLDVLFTPRFLECHERQHVDSAKEKSSINCSYSGNPAPKLTWFRQTDDKPITTDVGVSIETKDEHHGKYISIVTFDRSKLVAIPLTTTTTTRSPNAQQDTTPQPKITGDNYYQQLLNSGFSVKLTYNNEGKGSKKINIVGDANEARSKNVDNSSIKTIENLSTSIILFSVSIILYMIHH